MSNKPTLGEPPLFSLSVIHVQSIPTAAFARLFMSPDILANADADRSNSDTIERG
jgi:hypothetical protein